MKKLKLVTIAFLLFGVSSYSQCDHTIIANNPTCFGFSDGSVTVVPTGGSGSYTITIENESGDIVNVGGSSAANSLTAGWYYTTVDDGAGCIDEDSVELINPGIMETVMVITDPSYPGACDGVAECDTVLNHQGAYEMISYIWSSGPPGGLGVTEKTSLCAGYYTLDITDEFGCATTAEFSLGSLVGIDATENKIEVFSSTLSKTIIVQNDFASQPLGFNIFNMAGQQVDGFELNAGKNELLVSSLSGVYIYTISQGGKTIKSGKLTF